MKIPAETLVQKFIRTYTEPFSAKEFAVFISKCGVKCSESEAEVFLQNDSNVFALANGLFATRACAFTGQYFSIKPVRKEFDKGVFVVGHRCMPFVDPDVLSCSLNFCYKKGILPKKVVELDSAYLLDLFSLFGDEYAPQYIAQDPANTGMDLAALDYILPNQVNITAVSLEPLIKDGFKYGDRILCRVVDWDNCIIEVDFIPRSEGHLQMSMEDVDRENWYNSLEKCLLESFQLAGPMSSIEEQLSLVFTDKRNELCVKNCGSLQEFFSRTTKIGFEFFGVETRLWYKGQDVPAIGKWNDASYSDSEGEKPVRPQVESFDQIPSFVVDCAIKDQLYSKVFDIYLLLRNLHPNSYRVSAIQRKVMLLHLKNRHDILSQTYNRFADSEIGDIRHRVLELFYQVNKLVYSIDLTCADLANFPQQSLVILSQIFAHINHILEIAEEDPASIVQESEELYLSIDGMEFNFECVEEELRAVIAKESKNGFIVIK